MPNNMCGRFSLDRKPEALKARFKAKLTLDENDTPLYNIAPSLKAACITNKTEPQISLMDWGLGSKGMDGKSRTLINARSESIHEKWPFKQLLKNRCLVIASGYIEWKTIGKMKIPHLHVLEDGDLFVMAGLFEENPDTDSQRFTLLTMDANTQTSVIHDRMPVILNKEEELLWLNEMDSSSDFLKNSKILNSKPLKIYPISPRINGSFKNDPALLERTAYTVVEQLQIF